jgi:hypothetical protein
MYVQVLLQFPHFLTISQPVEKSIVRLRAPRNWARGRSVKFCVIYCISSRYKALTIHFSRHDSRSSTRDQRGPNRCHHLRSGCRKYLGVPIGVRSPCGRIYSNDLFFYRDGSWQSGGTGEIAATSASFAMGATKNTFVHLYATNRGRNKLRVRVNNVNYICFNTRGEGVYPLNGETDVEPEPREADMTTNRKNGYWI